MINSLYVHIPFCEKICNYCDFPKLQYFHFFADKYLDSLGKELTDTVTNYDLKTIYVGGGTPTSLDLLELERLLKMLKPYSKKVEEYTFEVNPESATKDKLLLLKKYGVNRISMGVESTDDKILKAINRNHTFSQVSEAMKLLRAIGFNNINLDLILGLPNVSKKMVEKDIKNILNLSPDHISTYSLTIHPHTVFYLENQKEPDDDFSRELYDYVHDELSKHGYIHYEVSNFAKNGYKSKHNLVYWKNEKYYGIGLGAAGYIDNVRYKNTDNLDKYLKNDFCRENETITNEDDRKYQIILNLRSDEGIDLNLYQEKFNKDLYIEKKKEIDDFIKEKLLILKDNHLIPTYEGMMILDTIILKLL